VKEELGQGVNRPKVWRVYTRKCGKGAMKISLSIPMFCFYLQIFLFCLCKKNSKRVWMFFALIKNTSLNWILYMLRPFNSNFKTFTDYGVSLFFQWLQCISFFNDYDVLVRMNFPIKNNDVLYYPKCESVLRLKIK
jgi:hypothetical protein